MKAAWILACSLVLSSAAGLCQTTTGAAPLPREVLAAILGPAAVKGSACAVKPSEAVFAARKPGGMQKSACTATANCQSGTVSCSGNNTCTAVDAACPNQAGYVTCDGVTTNCPACSSGNSWCDDCAATGDCFSCCRCDGFSLRQCITFCD